MPPPPDVAQLLDKLADDVETTADGADPDAPFRVAYALREVADDIRRAAAAPARRQHPADKLDPELALAWLAQHDAEPIVRRAELIRRYVAEGAPGGLPAPLLRRLMADRWGAPVKRDGYDVHKPAAAVPSPALDDLGAIARLARVPHDALVALVAEHNPTQPTAEPAHAPET